MQVVTSGPGIYQCADCDFILGLPEGAQAVEHFDGVAGRPIDRIVSVDGVEVHRCQSLFLTLSS
jgi:hypothetical protein